MVPLSQLGTSPYSTHAFLGASAATAGARAYCSADARLFLNEYGIETPNTKSDAYYATYKALATSGAPLHGVGFESHFAMPGLPDVQVYPLPPLILPYPLDPFFQPGLHPLPCIIPSALPQAVAGNMKMFIDLGLELHVTELDVSIMPQYSANTLPAQWQAQVRD